MAAPHPNFFIVGAAKAGTTALHNALRHHPAIFMTGYKEPGFFSPDVSAPTQWNRDLDYYLRLFEGSEPYAVRGESSPSYLLSHEAAARIRSFAPDARILIILRDPIESIVSGYAEARKWGVEPKRSLTAAVHAGKSDRRAAQRRGGAWIRYIDVVHYAPQVERYLAAFPREQLHIARYDDLVDDPVAFLRSVFEFLDVDSVDVPIARENLKRAYRSATVQRLVMWRFARAREIGSVTSIRERSRRRALQLNYSRKPLAVPPALRAELAAEFGAETHRLSALTGLDLSGWLQPGEPLATSSHSR